MKKSAEILGLPVISITEGRELGISKTLVIDAVAGAVAAITVEDEDWYRGVKLLPYSAVVAIGRDAVMVISSGSILTLVEAVDYEAMLDANIRVIGTRAITKSGTINGMVREIFVDGEGRIESVQVVKAQGEETMIPADAIAVFGKQVTVVGAPGDGARRERTVSAPVPAASEPEPAAEMTPRPEPVPEPVPVMPEAAPEPEIVIEPEIAIEPALRPRKAAGRTMRTAKSAGGLEKTTAAYKATMNRHRRFLLGKKAGRDIVAGSGAVIVRAGEEITEAVLQKAQLAGKLVELSMNTQ
ncbi:MAG: PRC-barrel domain-containing protein [Schwartzia sp.]|nr:PRC-barrel domain-containing protein [Schwartzia sp. (in: firmicutes)]